MKKTAFKVYFSDNDYKIVFTGCVTNAAIIARSERINEGKTHEILVIYKDKSKNGNHFEWDHCCKGIEVKY